MSPFLSNCLRGAIISSLGAAMLNFIFAILAVVILGAITGPGAVVAVGVALPIALAAALIFGAVMLIALVLTCLREDGRQPPVQAGAPAGGGQALEEDKEPARCIYCEKLRKQLTLVGSAAGIAVGVIVSII